MHHAHALAMYERSIEQVFLGEMSVRLQMTVSRIAQHRMLDLREVSSDLMRAPGLDRHAQQRMTTEHFDAPIFRDRVVRLASIGQRRTDRSLVARDATHQHEKRFL